MKINVCSCSTLKFLTNILTVCQNILHVYELCFKFCRDIDLEQPEFISVYFIADIS